MISPSSLPANMWAPGIQLSYSSRIIEVNSFYINWLVWWVLFIKVQCSRIINIDNLDCWAKTISWDFSPSTRIIYDLTIQSQLPSLFQRFKIALSSDPLHISIDHIRSVSFCHLFARGELNGGVYFDAVQKFQRMIMLMLINRIINFLTDVTT